MNKPTNRLHFLDAIRAFAIIMMLQGHFVHALLADHFRDKTNLYYNIWEYFRGITAPTFFTITGFIFTFLLLKQKARGLENPRVLKGVKRGIKLIIWGYLLRISFFAIFNGSINPSFFYVDVLQCIGVSILLLIILYLVFYSDGYKLFQSILLVLGVGIFLVQPIIETTTLHFLPETLANYFTKEYGSIFTIIPWFGYVCFGGFLAITFLRYGKQPKFYPFIISMLLVSGFFLTNLSSGFLMILYNLTEIEIFKLVAYNNYLFIRLGNVSILFAIFIWLRNYLTNSMLTKVGGSTLSLYILHFFVLYGSWFGLGLNRFFYRALNPGEIVVGAILFVIGICFLVLAYNQRKTYLKDLRNRIGIYVYSKARNIRISNTFISRMMRYYQSFRLGKR